MKRPFADGTYVWLNNEIIVKAESMIEATIAAQNIRKLMQQAFTLGYRDGFNDDDEHSPFDNDRTEPDEDEAPLIDVPDGCNDPEYGPEKIPPRKGKSSLTAEIEELHKLLDEAKEQANKISLEAEKTYKNTTVSLSDMPVNHH